MSLSSRRRIGAHVTLCMLGYLLERVVGIEMGVSFETVRKLFARRPTVAAAGAGP